MAFVPSGPDAATARLEIDRTGIVEAASGVRGFKLLRLGGSAFRGFVRDEYTTLPDLHNRPLHMWLDLEWSYADARRRVQRRRGDRAGAADRARCVHVVRVRQHPAGDLSDGDEDARRHPAIAEMRLEANNRTWDTIAERGDELGVYTDARPPYGCLGLTLKRDKNL